jgi:hypothetical protein
VWTVFVTEEDLISGIKPTPQQIIRDSPKNAPQLDVIFKSDNSPEQRVQAIQLTTSWSVDYEDGTGTGVESDSPHALHLSPDLFNDTSIRLLAANGSITLQFSDDYPPEHVFVKRWNALRGYKQDDWDIAHLLDLNESVEIDGNMIHVSHDGCDYIYEVYARWSNGESHYTFRTVDSEINEFWTVFREAVLSRDYDAIAEFVNFPLETRGDLDGDPIITVGIEKFEDVFSAFLELLNGDRTWYHTNFYDVEQNMYFSHYGNESARAGNMEFEKINGEWKLTFIYIDGDEW